MKIQDSILRCMLRCQAEAVSLGFPPEAGNAIFIGCTADDINSWTEEQFLEWVQSIEDRFLDPMQPVTSRDKLRELYESCSRIMGEFGELVSHA